MSDPYISGFDVEHAEPVAKGVSYYAGRLVSGAGKGGALRRMPKKVGRSMKGDFDFGRARGGPTGGQPSAHEASSRVARRVGRRDERFS